MNKDALEMVRRTVSLYLRYPLECSIKTDPGKARLQRLEEVFLFQRSRYQHKAARITKNQGNMLHQRNKIKPQ